MSDDEKTTGAPEAQEPTPVVPPSAASYGNPAGTAAPGPGAGGAPLDRPEVAVGAAFAGGLVAAMILRRLGR